MSIRKFQGLKYINDQEISSFMDVFIERTNKKLTLTYQGKVQGLLEHLKLNPETVLVVRNDQLVTEQEKLKNSDSIKILSVISGG